MPLPSSFQHRFGPWAVVTGASSGIGAEFARQLSAANISLVLVARRQSRLQQLSHQIQQHTSVRTLCIEADLSTDAGCQAVISQTKNLDVALLVNNAGVGLSGSFFHHTSQQHADLIRLNCLAVTTLAHAFGRRFVDNRRGGILFVSSMASKPVPWAASYSSSKSFVTSLALILREQFRRQGVEVMVLEPGFVVSEMTEEVKYNRMPTERCVAAALDAFGSRARFTPGWLESIYNMLRTVLPINFQMWVLSNILEKGYAERGSLTYVDPEGT